MAYPQKPPTRQNSADAFKHVFSLFPSNDTAPILLALDAMGIGTLMDLLVEHPDDFDTYK